MLNIAFSNFDTMIVLIVLAGSLVGSTMTFLGRRATPDEGPFFGTRTNPYGYERPADWPKARQNQMQVTSYTETPRRRTGMLAGLVIAGITFVAGTSGIFAYQSPWDTETDLRHLAATVHCKAAVLVGLAPAVRGAPGYHIRNDRDGNGIACETQTPALVLGTGPEGPVGRLSNIEIAWPTVTQPLRSQ